jgi:recombination protein RecT
MTDLQKVDKKTDVRNLINGMKNHFKNALPKHFESERFTRIALTSISKNPKLAECSRDSLLGALMTFAQLGLEPNTPLGHAHLAGFGGDVTAIIGYKGYIDLAYRTGSYDVIDVHEVYECDEFEFELGLDPNLKHKPGRPEKGKTKGDPIWFYAFYKLKSGGKRFRVWSREECLEHGKKHSKSYNRKDMPWQKNPNAMCKKTVIRDLLSLAPMSPEDRQMWAVAQSDNGVIRFNQETSETNVAFDTPALQEGEGMESVEGDIMDEELV